MLTSRRWQDQNGNNRISYEVVTDTVEILSNASNSTNNVQATNNSQSGGFTTKAAQQGFETVYSDEELPF